VNAGITGGIPHIDGGQFPDTEIPASDFRQGRTSPPFPISASRCETARAGDAAGPARRQISREAA
jgi:hypothetical protein